MERPFFGELKDGMWICPNCHLNTCMCGGLGPPAVPYLRRDQANLASEIEALKNQVGELQKMRNR